MAAKGKAGKKTAKAKVSRQSTKTKAKPKGLQLSSAQWKAYTKAYTATASRLYAAATLKRAASRFRKYRLQAAYATQAQNRKAYGSAQRAATAAYAAGQSYKQSVRAHQNAALRRRVYNDMYSKYNNLGRVQFAQAGQRKWTHRAVMRTVDTAQAVNHEEALRRAAARAAKAGVKSKHKKGKYGSPLPKSTVAAIKKQATAAASAAARRAPGGAGNAKGGAKKKATRGRGRPKGATIANGAARKGQGAQKKASQQAQKAALTKAAASKKAPVASPKARAAAGRKSGRCWLDSREPACVAVAVANQIKHQTGIVLTAEQFEDLKEITGVNVDIEVALSRLKCGLSEGNLFLKDFYRSDSRIGTIVGYDSRYGSHAALSLSPWTVASWGSTRIRQRTEESWWADWEVR